MLISVQSIRYLDDLNSGASGACCSLRSFRSPGQEMTTGIKGTVIPAGGWGIETWKRHGEQVLVVVACPQVGGVGM